MAKVIHCECGFTVRGQDDEELVANGQRHVQEAHPEMAGQMSREDFLAMAEDE
jgi:predicted small metal-binding protein